MMNRRSFMNYLGADGIATPNAVPGAQKFIGVPSIASAGAGLESASVENEPEFRRISLADHEDRVYGTWLGKIVGAFFGRPFE